MRIFMYLYTQIRLLIMYKDNIEHTTSIKTAEGYHVPVLLGESIDGLNLKRDIRRRRTLKRDSITTRPRRSSLQL